MGCSVSHADTYQAPPSTILSTAGLAGFLTFIQLWEPDLMERIYGKVLDRTPF
jgi:hypothetical protein